jgi:hypothetical protein
MAIPIMAGKFTRNVMYDLGMIKKEFLTRTENQGLALNLGKLPEFIKGMETKIAGADFGRFGQKALHPSIKYLGTIKYAHAKFGGALLHFD